MTRLTRHATVANGVRAQTSTRTLMNDVSFIALQCPVFLLLLLFFPPLLTISDWHLVDRIGTCYERRNSRVGLKMW